MFGIFGNHPTGRKSKSLFQWVFLNHASGSVLSNPNRKTGWKKSCLHQRICSLSSCLQCFSIPAGAGLLPSTVLLGRGGRSKVSPSETTWFFEPKEMLLPLLPLGSQWRGYLGCPKDQKVITPIYLIFSVGHIPLILTICKLPSPGHPSRPVSTGLSWWILLGPFRLQGICSFWKNHPRSSYPLLGGGFKHFLFSSLLGEDSHFD